MSSNVDATAAVRVALLTDVEAMLEADRLLRRVWETADDEDAPMAVDIMAALAHTGGYVAGAYLGTRLIGVAAGFLAEGQTLHSHIAGVATEARGHGVGRALKEHQRLWAKARGLSGVTWTFDPLVRRNAHFNLSRLGARAEAYLPDFYGPLRDGLNNGGTSDRLFVRWPTDGGTRPSESTVPSVAIVDEHGGVHPAGDASWLRCSTPRDIEVLRRQRPALATHWRLALRTALGAAMDDGYRIIGFDRDGCYLLERTGSQG